MYHQWYSNLWSWDACMYCVYMHVCVCVDVSLGGYICVHIIWLCVCRRVWMHIYLFLCLGISVSLCVFACLCVYVCVSLCLCLFVRACVCTWMSFTAILCWSTVYVPNSSAAGECTTISRTSLNTDNRWHNLNTSPDTFREKGIAF